MSDAILMSDAIDIALESLQGAIIVLLKSKTPVIKDIPVPPPDPRMPPQQHFFVMEQCFQFQSESHRRVGNGWEFRLKERSADNNKMVSILLTVRTDEILMVRAVSALEAT